jgi:hypothetical protein
LQRECAAFPERTAQGLETFLEPFRVRAQAISQATARLTEMLAQSCREIFQGRRSSVAQAARNAACFAEDNNFRVGTI